MKVYRVQKLTGEGPYWYAPCTFKGMNLGSYHTNDTHPAPSNDGLSSVRDREQYRFGFVSRESYLAWFEREVREEISKLGFFLFTFEVDESHVVKGTYQCAFVRNQAELLSYEPLI